MLHDLTLERLARRGEIRIGFQRHTPPFSSTTGDAFEPLGYSVDLAKAVVKRLSATCRSPLAIIPVETTSTTREAMLLAGGFDIECGSTTITDLRRQRVAFSQPIFQTSHRVALRRCAFNATGKTLRITGIDGSTSQAALLSQAPAGWDFEFQGHPSIGQAFDAYRFDSKVDGLVADEVILASLLSRAGDTETTMLEQRMGLESYGFMLRQTDRELLAAVDDALGHLLGSTVFLQRLARWLPGATSGTAAVPGLACAAIAGQLSAPENSPMS